MMRKSTIEKIINTSKRWPELIQLIRESGEALNPAQIDTLVGHKEWRVRALMASSSKIPLSQTNIESLMSDKNSWVKNSLVYRHIEVGNVLTENDLLVLLKEENPNLRSSVIIASPFSLLGDDFLLKELENSSNLVRSRVLEKAIYSSDGTKEKIGVNLLSSKLTNESITNIKTFFSKVFPSYSKEIHRLGVLHESKQINEFFAFDKKFKLESNEIEFLLKKEEISYSTKIELSENYELYSPPSNDFYLKFPLKNLHDAWVFKNISSHVDFLPSNRIIEKGLKADFDLVKKLYQDNQLKWERGLLMKNFNYKKECKPVAL